MRERSVDRSSRVPARNRRLDRNETEPLLRRILGIEVSLSCAPRLAWGGCGAATLVTYLSRTTAFVTTPRDTRRKPNNRFEGWTGSGGIDCNSKDVGTCSESTIATPSSFLLALTSVKMGIDEAQGEGGVWDRLKSSCHAWKVGVSRVWSVGSCVE